MRAIPTQTSCGTITVSQDDGDNGDGGNGGGGDGGGAQLGTTEILAGASGVGLLLWFVTKGD